MEKLILPFNWRDELGNVETCSIDNDFILLEKPVIVSALNQPFKVDVTIAVICFRGTMRGVTNMTHYVTHAPCLFIVLSGQILQYESFSEDFSGLFIIMSGRFLNDLVQNAQESLLLSLSVRDRPWLTLSELELDAMVSYFNMIKRAIKVKENPYRKEIVKYLTKAFLYGVGFHFHKVSVKEEKTRQEALVEAFLNLVQTHYREERELKFYADKLCLTPMHLSKVVKAASHKSANEWINDHVILEAKALLKSTDMTIQQISEELNFPSQSFFGKYFKRCTGLSPREYKK